jgi:hypothetical protein
VTGLKSESVPGFIPESCPASFRNADRDDFGNVPALPRNPQKPSKSVFTFPHSELAEDRAVV